MDYLEHLSALLGCVYLSDLHWRTISRQQANTILAEPLDRPEHEYLDAARYILGDCAGEYPDAGDARKAIAAYLINH